MAAVLVVLLASSLVAVVACTTRQPQPSPTAGSTPMPCPSDPAAWTAASSPGMPRADHVAVRLADGRVLIAGGDNGDRHQASAEIYDPTRDQWAPAAPMSMRRVGHTATLLADGRVLVVGGAGNAVPAELFDPTAGTWTPAGPMVYVRSWQTATRLADGRVLLVGGIGGIGLAASSAHTQPAELFESGSGTWTRTGPMMFNRLGHTATLLADGRVLVAGGRSQSGGQPRASSEIFDPATSEWTVTGDLLVPRADFVAVRLADGTVLAAGGVTLDGELATGSERFDPVTGHWTPTRAMDSGGILLGNPLAAVLRCDGSVLFAGGSQGTPATALYEPASDELVYAGDMVGAHSSHTLTVLEDGRVLAVGGRDESGMVTAASELYGPIPRPAGP